MGSKNEFPVNIFTNNTQRMSITTDGDVGIGLATSTTPAARLDIQSSSSTQPALRVSDNTHVLSLAINGGAIIADGLPGDQDILYYAKGNAGSHIFFTKATITSPPTEVFRINGSNNHRRNINEKLQAQYYSGNL